MKELKKRKRGPLDGPKEIAPARKKNVGGSKPLGRSLLIDEAEAINLSTGEYFSHPANAGPMAELFGHLQQSHGNAYVQRFVSGMKESGRASSGQGLDAQTRAEMESAFGEDFGHVRIHTGTDAESISEELGARAVTRGEDIYFDQGEYNPSTPEGKKSLAHELAHVIQQRASALNDQAKSIDQAGDMFEREADRAADSVISGRQAQVSHRSDAPAFQRQRRPEPPRIEHYGLRVLEANRTWTYGFEDLTVRALLSTTQGASLDTLHITVPAGVGVLVVDLVGMNMQVRDPGGTGRRPIIIIAPRQAQGLRLIQVTFTKGSRVYVVTFQFPVAAAATTPPRAPAAGGRP